MNRRVVSFVALVAMCLAGCGGGSESSPVAQQTSHLRLLTMLYAKISSQLGRNPKDEQEFKQAIQNSDVTLEALKVESLDELFVSERDGQPFVVVYGPQPPGSDVIVYEKTGVDGMRQVGHKIGKIDEVDAARFNELVPAAGAAK